jgi:uncharacterized membrane protein YeaQ/YmgE (transglycosylase-associated protein family)
MFELSATAQHWVNVVLIWVGFGSLAGILARAVLPFREPYGPWLTLTLGIVGSAVGLGGLSWIVGNAPHNPISPQGFLAATVGAFCAFIIYRVLRAVVPHEGEAEQKPAPASADEAEDDE